MSTNNKLRDYYDLPSEWMPSANFANRPTSDISKIYSMDATNFISSSSSSSSSLSGNEEGPKFRRRSASRPPDSPQTPSIRVTGPYEEHERSRMRSVDEDAKIMDRPRLRKKSATAPPGGINIQSHVPQPPQPPRRALSARPGALETIQGRNAQQETYVTNPLVVRQRLEREQSGRHQMPQPGRPPPRPPRADERDFGDRLTHRTRLSASFSQKARVKKTLDDKNLSRLSIVDFEARGLLSSPRTPRSMMHTPHELYAIPEKRSTARSPLSRQGPSSPHANEARISILSNLSPLSPQFQQSLLERPRKKKGKKIHEVGRKRIYVPGPIRLEPHPASSRKGSVATLNPFDEAGETRSKRYSDMIVLNSLTMFFADLSDIEDATEQCLDRFWRDPEPQRRHVASASHKPSITSVEEMRVPEIPGKPQNRWSPRDSRFSFSSASSSSSMPPPGAPKHKRDKLKRLLSPAFVGSAK